MRPTTWVPLLAALLIVPDAVNGAVSLTAPSIRMPTLLYLSTRVRSMTSLRAPSTGARRAAVDGARKLVIDQIGRAHV